MRRGWRVHRLHVRLKLGVIALACFAASCGTDAPSATSSTASIPTAKKFGGKLTIERILDADGLVNPLEPWTVAKRKLDERIGDPTRVHEDYEEWAVVDGDRCAFTRVQKVVDKEVTEGFSVGVVVRPRTVEKSGGLMDYRDCLAITGVGAGPAEDPNAAGPPTDGAPIPLERFAEAAVKGRSKWSGKRVKVSALLRSITTTTMTAGDRNVDATSLDLVADKEKKEPNVTCSLRRDEAKPESKSYAPVVVEGRVSIDESFSGDDNATFAARLEDCVIATALDEK